MRRFGYDNPEKRSETHFDAAYGDVANGFAHVHRLRPVSEVGGECEVDPVHDLRPVPPDCHAVIRLGGEHVGFEVVRQLLQLASQLRQPVRSR